MSVHDETWDKCPKCKQTIKTFHGNYHDDGGCEKYDSWHEYNDLKTTYDFYQSKEENSNILRDIENYMENPEKYTPNWELIARRLWELLDDIDTAFDHYKPDMKDPFVNYVDHKCRERYDYMDSDGYNLKPKIDLPVEEDLDPMCKWFKDAWRIEKQKQ